MVVVNTKENQPPRILCIKMKKSNTLFNMLLDSLTKEGKSTGVKRNNYYLLTVDAVYMSRVPEQSKEHFTLMTLVKHAARLYYTYLMLIYE
jgi:hypothetical protein